MTSTDTSPRKAIRPAEVTRDFRRTWRRMLVAHLLCSIVIAAILWPAAGILLRSFLRLSGRSSLSDLEIAQFLFFTPIGIMGLILAASIALTISIFEHAILVLIGLAASFDRDLSWREVVGRTASKGWPLYRLAAVVVGTVLVMVIPLLLLAGLTYWLLLTKYDINFYLNHRPREFWFASAIGAILAVGMIWLVGRLVVGWVVALPILWMRRVSPREALSISRKTTARHRRYIACCVGIWVATWAVTLAGTHGILTLAGRTIIPYFAESIAMLALTLGLMVLLSALLNWVISFVGAATFALFVVRLYRALNDSPSSDTAHFVDADDTYVSWIKFTRRRFLVIGLVAVAGAFIFGVVLLKGMKFEDRAQITAHRGASAAAPENTLASFEQAIAEGADWVELDVQETADGVVVIVHDQDLMKVGEAGLKIWDSTLEQLREIDIGSFKDPKFHDQRVATLAEALDLCKGRVRVNIELKYYGHQDRLEERVVEIVESKQMQNDIVIMSLDYAGVQKIRALRPDWTIGVLQSAAIGDVMKRDVDFFAVNAKAATPAFIAAAHLHGKEVLVWTVNDPASMSIMMSRGVDGIITDYPAMGKSVLRQRAKLSSPERLLLELAIVLGIKPKIAAQ